MLDADQGSPPGLVPGTSPSGGSTPERPGGIIDAGAVFAGWVGLGMALVITISLELVLAVQPLVFLIAPFTGFLIGYYANQRSGRWRPRGRVLVNAAYAGLVTGVGLAVIYALLRLVFVFADTGYRPPGLGGQLDCQPGPECTYMRYVEEGRAADLAAAGATDGASFGDLVLREQATGAVIITLLTLGGAVAAGAVRAVGTPPAQGEADGRGVLAG
jgi:hypothetical protein